MMRKTKRVLQTSWEVYLQKTWDHETRDYKEVDKDKRVAIVVMHRERNATERNAKGVQADDEVAKDAEEVALDMLVPEDLHIMHHYIATANQEKVHLTPVQRAQLHTDPCKYHFACMQKDGDIDEAANYKDFAKYVSAVKMNSRPWEIHTVNKFSKKLILKQFTSIMLASSDNSWRNEEIEVAKMSFDTWKTWWDQSDNRKSWDGGLAMTHRTPPGSMDPFDYDKSN